MRKTYIYLFFNIIFPVLCILGLPYVILYFANEINIKIGLNLDNILTFDFTKITQTVSYFMLYLAISILTYITIRKINTNKEFLAGNLYGIYYWIWYLLGKYLGYKRISLKRKPYKIIYKLLESKNYEIIDEQCVSEKTEYSTKEIKGNEESIYNVIIADTYLIEISQIPIIYKDNKCIVFNREGKDGSRVFSEEYLKLIGKHINELKQKKYKINFFMTTNACSTKYIFENYLMIGDRDYINVEIFQQSKKGSRNFFNKGYKISN